MPALSSKAILDAVSHDPSRGGLQGRVYALRQRMRNGMNGLNAPSSHVKLLAELEQMAQSAPRAPAAYLHPGEAAQAKVNRSAMLPDDKGIPKNASLTPADVAWISRLPRDPEEVSYEDAVTLAGLANSVSPASHASDARLVQSAWAPVREVHDRRQAEAELVRVQSTPAPQVPPSALGALADAYQHEIPQLRPEEALARASADLDKTLEQREMALLDAGMKASGALAMAKAQTANRTSPTRMPEPVPGSFPLGGF